MHRPYKYKRGDILERTYGDPSAREEYVDYFMVIERDSRPVRIGKKQGRTRYIKEYRLWNISDDTIELVRASNIDNAKFLLRYRRRGKHHGVINIWRKVSC